MSDENTSVRMLNPAHPGEILRESIEACEWTVTEAAGTTRGRTSGPVTFAEWSFGYLAVDGAGDRATRLG